jgi:hypothetical protein
MGDRFPAEIRIGGKISRTKRCEHDPDETILDCLIGMINGAGVSREYGGATAEIPVNEQDEGDAELLQYSDDEGCLRFRDDQARNGEFEELEEFLVVHDIPYDRWGDHYCEYDAENAYFRPGMKVPLITYADARGDEIVCGDTVRKALAMLESVVSGGGSNIHEAIRCLKDACPAEPDALEKFEIVD